MSRCHKIELSGRVEDSRLVEGSSEEFPVAEFAVVHCVQPTNVKALHVCLERLVECVSGCTTEVFAYPFCSSSCCGVLPRGRYRASLPDQRAYPHLDGAVTVGLFIESVDLAYVQAVTANKAGGC